MHRLGGRWRVSLGQICKVNDLLIQPSLVRALVATRLEFIVWNQSPVKSSRSIRRVKATFSLTFLGLPVKHRLLMP